MNELEERARRMLEVARDRHNPNDADAARVRSALKARIVANPGLLAAPSGAALERTVLGKVLVALGVGAVTGFAAGLYVAQSLGRVPDAPPLEATARHEVPAPNVANEQVVASTVEAETSVGEPAASEASNPQIALAPTLEAVSAARRGKQLPAPASPVTSGLKAELDGLRRAQELLHQGQPAWALARLNELDAAQVGSVLMEERVATRVIAECMLGKDAEVQLAELSRRFPKSAHLERVRSSCSKVAQTGSPAENPASRQTETPGPRHE